ncbi:MAG: hypothetical protein Q8922_09235 [Bacteroidota bacterium]|nr:hypothetical protein [Bacteroidota bacterium]MDP4234217.1 hypothetical protein [Bacteroidota bacterium]MDP4243407.1 hypothetical protein [Bacteroidota bacterium]MDP4288106.1 hypothetical protein [Bacteroidota bacterium]
MKIFYSVAFLILLPFGAFGQWHQIPGPPGAGPYCYDTLAGSKGSHIYAGTEDGAWRTTDHFQTWKRAGLAGKTITALASIFVPLQGDVLFAGADSGVYRSLDSGSTWQNVLPDSKQSSYIALIPKGQAILVVLTNDDTNDCVFRSSDLGDHWNRFAKAPPGSDAYSISAAVPCGGYLFVINGGPFVWSLPFAGGGWGQTGYSSTQGPMSLATFGTNLFAGSTGRVDLSTNFGQSWVTPINYGLDSNIDDIGQLVVNGLTMVAGTSNGIFLSTDGARSWTSVDGQGGYPDYYSTGGGGAYGLTYVSGSFLSSEEGGLFQSSDGKAWQYVPQGIHASFIANVASSEGTLFASTDFGPGSAIFQSSDRGLTWLTPATIEGASTFYHLLGNLYAVGDGSVIWRWNGTSWEALASPALTPTLTAIGDTLILGSATGDAFESLDNGSSWQALSPIPEQVPFAVEAVITFRDTVLALTLQADTIWRLWRSPDAGKTWSDAGILPLTGGWLVASAVTESRMCLCFGDEILTSIDGGANWSSINLMASSAHTIGSKIFLTLAYNPSPADNGLFVLDQNLTQLIPESTTGPMQAFGIDSSTAYIGTVQNGLWAVPLSNIPLSVPMHAAITLGELCIYPNPMASNATISLDLTTRGHVTLRLYDEAGALRAVIYDGSIETGHTDLPLSMNNLPNGSYVVIADGDVQAIGRIVIER